MFISLAVFGLAAVPCLTVGLQQRKTPLPFRQRLWPQLPGDVVVSTATGAPVA